MKIYKYMQIGRRGMIRCICFDQKTYGALFLGIVVIVTLASLCAVLLHWMHRE